MARSGLLLGLILGLLPSLAMAGTTSSKFSVGITIGEGGNAAKQAAVPATTYTWGAAAISVKRAGFENLRQVERSETLYWFAGERAGGSYRIAISIVSGEVVKVIPA